MKPCRRQPQDSSPCLRAAARSVLTGRRPDVRRMGGGGRGVVRSQLAGGRGRPPLPGHGASATAGGRGRPPLPGHDASATAGGRGRPPLPGHDASATAGGQGRPPLPGHNASATAGGQGRPPLPGHNASATAGGRGRPPLLGHGASATAGGRGRPPLPEKNASVYSVIGRRPFCVFCGKKKRADATERVPPPANPTRTRRSASLPWGKKGLPEGEAFDRMEAERVSRSSARIPS